MSRDKNPEPLTITVRGMDSDDWEDSAALLASGNVAYYTLQLPYMSRDYIRERAENMPGDLTMLAAEVDGVMVGQLGLHRKSGRQQHMADMGMMVHADYQGQGVGSALMEAAIDLADNWYNLSRIELTVFIDNTTAIALYEKFGFVIEGTLRDYAFRGGQYVDSYVMARLRTEAGA